MTPRNQSTDRRLTSADICQRFNIAPRTLEGWLKDPSVALPPAIVIRGRRYWPLDSIEAWEQARMSAPVAAVA